MIGIDPAGVMHFRSIFREFVNRGGTIIMSSHILSEVESLCTTLAVIHSGRMVFRGDIEGFIRSELKSRTISVDVEGATGALIAALAAIKGVRRVTPRAGGLLVEAENDPDPRSEISRLVVESGAKLLALGYSRSELDEAYLSSIRGTSQ
jgi:ABC-2 type transport system ATP-binding protein